MTNSAFDILLLVGRPACGKSEIIQYLLHLPTDALIQYHLSAVDVLDDFPILWSWFEEDDILEKKFGLPRMHSDEQGYFKFRELWHLLIERLCLEYGKITRDNPGYHQDHTTLIEFSRGAEHGGYLEAFQHLSENVLQRAAILYVRVPFEESLRKNRRRYNPDKPDSVLEHGLPDEKMERLYREDDFAEIAPGDSGVILINGFHVPFAVFANEDDVTTNKPEQLASRLQAVLGELWKLYINS